MAIRKTAARAVLVAALAAAPALLLVSFAPPERAAAVEGERRTGWLHLVWRDAPGRAEGPFYLLVDDAGRATALTLRAGELAPYGGALALNGRRVSVEGEALSAAAGAGPVRAPALRVRALRPVDGPRRAVQAGPRPFATLLCRFADQPGSDARPRAEYERWMGAERPGLDHFWRELSEERITLDGTRVFGPYVLPKPRSAYIVGGRAQLAELVEDCTGAADADVFFPTYTGVNLQFNADLDGYSWGGGYTLSRDGVTRGYGMTWMAGWADLMVYAHEAGHSFGLPHSSGPYDQVYDSKWDVMSGGGRFDDALGTTVPPHTIAWHKELLGWVPEARMLRLEAGADTTVLLARSALSGADGVQAIRIAAGTTGGVFYTVEARRFTGYDAGLPAQAVVLHRVNPGGNGSPARVVDPDGDGDPNDQGAMWLPGETFEDVASGIRVSVLEATPEGYRVRVSAPPRLQIVSAPGRPEGVVGTPYADQLEAAEAATWTVTSGSLPPGLSLGPQGAVTGIPERSGYFEFTVEARAGERVGTAVLAVVVGEPALERGAVMDALLGVAPGLDADGRRYLDLAGNKNGQVDVGDVRAWLVREQVIQP
jgi:M6 family metalloprotease-like protein